MWFYENFKDCFQKEKIINIERTRPLYKRLRYIDRTERIIPIENYYLIISSGTICVLLLAGLFLLLKECFEGVGPDILCNLTNNSTMQESIGFIPLLFSSTILKNRNKTNQPAIKLNIFTIFKFTLLSFIPLLLLLSSLMAFTYYNESKTITNFYFEEEIKQLRLQEKLIISEIRNGISDLFLIAKQSELIKLVSNNNLNDLTEGLENDYILLLKERRLYYKIAYIDKSGKEIIKGGFKNGKLHIFSNEEKSDKSLTKYFKETINLKPNQVYVSEFDLSRDVNGKVAEPYMPVLRFASPVFDNNGNNNGIIVLFMIAENIFDKIENANKSGDENTMLLNSNGYWIFGLNTNWSFAAEGKDDEMFSNYFPEVWDELVATGQGQNTKYEGIFSYITLYPMVEAIKFTIETNGVTVPEKYLANNKKYFLKLISFIPPTTLQGKLEEYVEKILPIYLLTLSVMALGSILLARSWTRQKMVEKALELQRQTAEAATEAKSIFLASMSHEVRTPMNGVIGMVNLLHDTKLNEKQKNIADMIKSSGEVLLSLINSILDISKIEAGKMELEHIEFNLKKVLLDIVGVLFIKAKSKGVEIVCRMEGKVPTLLTGDPDRLRQIFLNLTGNAVKFTNKGKIEIVAKLIDENEYELTMEFKVKDSGIGIDVSEGKADILFDAFTQADNSTTRKYGGTGLGLAISKQLCLLMKGDINVNSKVGKGTTFTFFACFAKPAATQIYSSGVLEFGDTEKIVSISKETEEKLITSIICAKIKVLVVEDNLINRKVVEHMLSKLQCTIEFAINGEEAISIFKKTYFDIIFMDCQMPVMDGFEATMQIRELELPRSKVPIIAMTANAIKGDKERCLDVGMDDYIAKPISKKEVMEALQKWCNFDWKSNDQISMQ